MASLLTPALRGGDADEIYTADPQDVERDARRTLLRDPKVWRIELLRISAYLFGRVLAVPWLLVWPALVFWLLWARAGFDLGQIGHDGQAASWAWMAWIYGLGATLHSLTVLGVRPYESEVERRLKAYMDFWHARRRLRLIQIAARGAI